MKINKKGILGQLAGTIQMVGFLAIFGAVMVIVLSNVQNATTDTNALNAIKNATAGIGNTFAQLPLFGTILGLMLILGVVFLLVRGGNIGGGGGGIV